MDERARQRQFEDSFIRQLRQRAVGLANGAIPADRVIWETVPDGIDNVRATLGRMEVYDRSLLESLPGTLALQLRFQRRIFGPIRQTVSRLRAQVLPPLEALIADQPVAPVGREQVLDGLARYELLPRDQRPSAVVFASPTGFTQEAKALVHGAGARHTLILMGGREDGGWDVEMPPAVARGPWAKLFEFETVDERLKRLRHHLEQDAVSLDSRGVSVRELGQKMGVSREVAEQLIRKACRSDSRLMTVMHEGVLHVCRTPLGEEEQAMSMPIWSRIRKLLRMKPTTAERVREMTAQRVRLEQQRLEVDQKVNLLEADERGAVEQGAAAKSDVERKQAAGKLIRVRRDLRRLRAEASVFSQQIDILGTHVHHLTLAERGRKLDLPKAEELTKEAAAAERLMAELSANADLATSIEVGAQTPMMQAEEAAIMEEFKQAAAERASQTPQTASGAPAASERAPSGRSPANVPPIPTAERGRAKPELG